MGNAEVSFVTAPDGVRIAAASAGPKGASGVIFIHGVLHSRAIWKKQFADPALAALRLVACDVRGHGDSDKPLAREAYDVERYAGDLKAVIEASGIARPVLVGWSLGSRVMFSYLAACGTSRLGGVMIVGARMKVDGSRQKASDALDASSADDLETRIRSRREFVRACHEIEPSAEELFEITAAAMMVPPYVLRNIVGRPLDNEALIAGLDVPIRIVQGEKDRVSLAHYAQAAARLNPRIALSRYENIGHSPFFEAPERFNLELLSFVRGCETGRAKAS